jgi:hypothetical protein
MTNLDVICRVVVSVYRLGKIWNSPQFPVQLQNVLLASSLAIEQSNSYATPKLSLPRDQIPIK